VPIAVYGSDSSVHSCVKAIFYERFDDDAEQDSNLLRSGFQGGIWCGAQVAEMKTSFFKTKNYFF
jgi:hypothetical protein